MFMDETVRSEDRTRNKAKSTARVTDVEDVVYRASMKGHLSVAPERWAQLRALLHRDGIWRRMKVVREVALGMTFGTVDG